MTDKNGTKLKNGDWVKTSRWQEGCYVTIMGKIIKIIYFDNLAIIQDDKGFMIRRVSNEIELATMDEMLIYKLER